MSPEAIGQVTVQHRPCHEVYNGKQFTKTTSSTIHPLAIFFLAKRKWGKGTPCCRFLTFNDNLKDTSLANMSLKLVRIKV